MFEDDCGKCVICKKQLNLKTANCPVSVLCYECWLKRRTKEKEGIADIQCVKCNEFFERQKPIPDTFTCPYCGRCFSLEEYDDCDEEDIKKKLGN